MIEEIKSKLNNNINCDLSDYELKLLYAMDNDIDYQLFEYIVRRVNYYEDCCKIFGSEHVASTPSSITEDTICYVGDLSIYKKLPTYNLKYIYGDLDYRLDKVYNLENLELIIQDADFSDLISACGLESLQYIHESANFKSLISAEGLDNLQYIGRDIIFDSLLNGESLENLQYIGRTASFESLTSAKGLENLGFIGQDKIIN